mgnify:CR=1 FL=1
MANAFMDFDVEIDIPGTFSVYNSLTAIAVCSHFDVPAEKIAAAKKAGLVVSLWPGLKVEDLMLGAYLGADFLCTDIPVEYLKFAKEKAPWLKIKY